MVRYKKKYHQTGRSNRLLDLQLKAIKPGKRHSQKGKTYYEYRRNRSDMPGSRL